VVEPTVLFRGEGLLVVDKPPGLAATGRTLADPDCLQARLIEQFGRMVWAVHHLGHPLVGERLYGARPGPLHSRHALHAARIVLGGSPRRDFHAPLPEDLVRLALSLGLDPGRAAPREPARRGGAVVPARRSSPCPR
jgi:23S rRNA-/tRNA-specific pseudouridylate synthase